MTRLFISYRSRDSVKVDTLVSRLRTLTVKITETEATSRYTIWQDKTGIRDSQDWWEAIVDAIIDCEVFVFMVSHESVANPNCRAELSYARKRNRPIIPLVLEGEFFYNPVSGKNDIDFWKQIPQELDDLRAQFLFYEGTSFVPRLEAAIAAFADQPQRWRDIPADRPLDPRESSDETNNTITLYDEAVDYAFRTELTTAERKFQRLINLGDAEFADDAHQWILLLREYQTLINLDARENTRHRVAPRWEQYKKGFPKPFVPFFDPKNLKARYDPLAGETRSPELSFDDIMNEVKADVARRSAERLAEAEQFQNALLNNPPPQSDDPKIAAANKMWEDYFSSPTPVADLLPAPFEWCSIPAGNVIIEYGNWDNDNNVYVITHKRDFVVKPFQIAKYPVTNRQYQLFIDAPDGYSDSSCWNYSPRAQSWRSENDKARNTFGPEDTLPRTNINWYEAMAFCRWLNMKFNDVLGHTKTLPSFQITLPSEQQWQRAAGGNDGRIYAWGNEEPDKHRCNFDRKIGRPTVVTQYPSGASPYGVMDMSGNVWEWCLSNWDGNNDNLDNIIRVMRGGSWKDIEANLHVNYRAGDTADFSQSFIGMRLALVDTSSLDS